MSKKTRLLKSIMKLVLVEPSGNNKYTRFRRQMQRSGRARRLLNEYFQILARSEPGGSLASKWTAFMHAGKLEVWSVSIAKLFTSLTEEPPHSLANLEQRLKIFFSRLRDWWTQGKVKGGWLQAIEI